MKKISILLFFAVFHFLTTQGQNLYVSGQVYNKANETIIGANIVLLQPNDSSIITGTTTDLNGNFKLEIGHPQKVFIRISYIGYEDFFINKPLVSSSLSLGKLELTEKALTLEAVDVIAAAVPVVVKGDTTQLNAAAFKTNPDANIEDLISKMPGITSQDGKIQAQGETVQKVLLDGQEFFGDDASTVLKNLPAEIVDKIEIFDKRSDQSEASGFDDGNTIKTLNIITKVQFRNGAFGKVYGGYGSGDKWKGGLNLNFFNNKRRFSVLANTNNVNEQNFSTDDLLGVMSSSGGGQRGGGRQGGGQPNDAGNFLTDQKSGITTTNALGLNYANQWGKINFSGSYFLNHSDNNSENEVYRQYITNQNEGLIYRENQQNKSTNLNHRLNFRVEWKIDSLNSILFQPRISVQQNDATSSLFGDNSILSVLQSFTKSDYKSNLSGLNLSAPLLYRHSFRKRGRSFSMNVTPGYNQNEGDNYLNSYVQFYSDTLSFDRVDQYATRDIQGLTISSNITYTEPINKNSQLMFNYRTNYTKSESDRETFDSSYVYHDFSVFDTTLSNVYNSQYISHTFGSSYRYQQVKWNFSAGIAYQYAQLDGEQLFPTPYTIKKEFNNILPNAQLQYKFTKKKNLRLNYRSSNRAPSISQLQNVINNNNPLLLTTGNPELKQNWQNNVTFRYTTSNTEKMESFMSLLSGTLTKNNIVNNTTIASADTVIAPGITLVRGAQLSKPINLDGYFNVRSFNIYSFPIAIIKSSLNLNFGGSYTRNPGMINNQLNYSNSYNAGFGFALSSNISEYFDFTVSSNTTYNNISNTLQARLNSDYYNQTTRLKIQVMPWKWMVIQSDFNHQYNSGLSAGYNKNYFLWNAAVGCKFLKDNLGELRLTVFDITKENNSISRNTTETYYEDLKTNVLQQYVMLTFTYNINYYLDSKAK